MLASYCHNSIKPLRRRSTKAGTLLPFIDQTLRQTSPTAEITKRWHRTAALACKYCHSDQNLTAEIIIGLV